jgi:hypothetical protein
MKEDNRVILNDNRDLCVYVQDDNFLIDYDILVIDEENNVAIVFKNVLILFNNVLTQENNVAIEDKHVVNDWIKLIREDKNFSCWIGDLVR